MNDGTFAQDCEDGGYPLPAWQELGPALRVIFQPHPEVVSQGMAPEDVIEDVPVNALVNDTMNQRQHWFLIQLSQGRRLQAPDIAGHFNVTEKTAKRDIAALKARGLIEYVGARKTGFYQLTQR